MMYIAVEAKVANWVAKDLKKYLKWCKIEPLWGTLLLESVCFCVLSQLRVNEGPKVSERYQKNMKFDSQMGAPGAPKEPNTIKYEFQTISNLTPNLISMH